MKFWRDRIAPFVGDICLAIFAIVTLYASFTASPAEAYIFPRLSAVLLTLFCAANLGLRFHRPPSPPLTIPTLRKIAPGVAVMVVYAGLAETVGFYPSSTVAAFALMWIYGGESRRIGVSLAATALLLGLVYLLFGVLLRVQVPEPFWVD